MIKVSVIIPTHNRATWVKKSIQSVLNQTFKDFELIVIDDGSTDKTEEIVKSFRDKRVKYIRHKKSRGAAAARNTGIKKARGELIAFNDDDDLWQPEKLEKQVKAFKKTSKKMGVVYTGLKRILPNKKIYLPQPEIKKKQGHLLQELFLENFIDLPTAVVRRECFEKAGLFDETLPRYQDWELWLRIAQDYQFKFINETLVDSYLLPGGITRNKQALLKTTNHIFQKHKQIIEKDKAILAAWQFRLGDLYYHQEKMNQARNYFFQAIKNQPSFKYFRAIIKTILGKQVSEAIISVKIKLLER